MLRTILAILSGFGVMLVLVIVSTLVGVVVLLGPLQGGRRPPITQEYLLANLGSAVVAALMGGWICSRIGRPRSVGATWGLAAFVLVMSGITTVIDEPVGDGPPAWYAYAVLAIRVVGVLIGGFLERLRRSAGSKPKTLEEV
ncbi:MAG: hypothetical protein SFX72_18150 [Isosphaeraceae bacterium]|nr:hypothetical protein [Isosphaeraceae bacterium]